MRVSKKDVDVQLELPGAVIRQRRGFGQVASYDGLSGECFSLSAGVDTTPLFEGLEGDLCQCPHWGYLVSGRIIATDAEGVEETVHAQDLFHWPSGHKVRVEEDAEIVMFSPQDEHTLVIDHMKRKVASS